MRASLSAWAWGVCDKRIHIGLMKSVAPPSTSTGMKAFHGATDKATRLRWRAESSFQFST